MSKQPRKTSDKLENMRIEPEPVLTAEEKQARLEQRMDAFLSWEFESAQRSIVTFATELLEVDRYTDPAYRFEWGGGAFEAAAKASTFRLAKMILDEDGFEKLVKRAEREVYTFALYNSHSTGPLHNLGAELRAAAWARVLETADRAK